MPSPPPSTANVNLRPIPDGPGKRVAELQGLDKVTARTQRFYAPVGESTRFGTLAITVSDCLVNVPEAPPESVAYLTIVDNKPGQAAEKLFAGWMFASTPSLSSAPRRKSGPSCTVATLRRLSGVPSCSRITTRSRSSMNSSEVW